MTPYDHIAVGQHWLRLWVKAWRHQAIARRNADLSSKVFPDIPLRIVSKEMLTNLISNVCPEITLSKFAPYPPEAIELS